jgi:hypothetical protein
MKQRFQEYISPSILWIALTGCAATGGQHGSAPTGAPAGAVLSPIAAPLLPLATPPLSAKRLVLNMSGPAAVTQSRDWPAFQELWRSTFADYARDAGVAFDVQKGEAQSTGEAGTLLQVYVNNYRMMSIVGGIVFGGMTGDAFIDAKARDTDLSNGKEFGERTYKTTSAARVGIFAQLTPPQVHAIAAKVFGELVTASNQLGCRTDSSTDLELAVNGDGARWIIIAPARKVDTGLDRRYGGQRGVPIDLEIAKPLELALQKKIADLQSVGKGEDRHANVTRIKIVSVSHDVAFLGMGVAQAHVGFDFYVCVNGDVPESSVVKTVARNGPDISTLWHQPRGQELQDGFRKAADEAFSAIVDFALRPPE